MSAPQRRTTGGPQGLVLGPLISYSCFLGDIISWQGFCFHCPAADTQLMLSFPLNDIHIPAWIFACVDDISYFDSASPEAKS